MPHQWCEIIAALSKVFYSPQRGGRIGLFWWLLAVGFFLLAVGRFPLAHFSCWQIPVGSFFLLANSRWLIFPVGKFPLARFSCWQMSVGSFRVCICSLDRFPRRLCPIAITCIYLRMYIHAYIHIYICICIFACTYIHIYMYICMSLWLLSGFVIETETKNRKTKMDSLKTEN